MVVKEGLQYPCDTGGYCVVFYTFTSMSLIFSCCDLITSTSFSRLTSTWSLTLSPALLPSLAIRHAVVTLNGRWVCSMLDCSWALHNSDLRDTHEYIHEQV